MGICGFSSSNMAASISFIGRVVIMPERSLTPAGFSRRHQEIAG
jgi:hypothetical protein